VIKNLHNSVIFNLSAFQIIVLWRLSGDKITAVAIMLLSIATKTFMDALSSLAPRFYNAFSTLMSDN